MASFSPSIQNILLLTNIVHQNLLNQVTKTKLNKKHTSHDHGSSKLTSRQPRKRSIDGKAVKRFVSPRNLSRNRSLERSAKEPRLLTPYTNEKTRSAAAKESKHEAPKYTKTKGDEKTERYNELSPLMTKIVEEELRNIMINVWQALPDTVNDEAEKMVLEKLEGAVGDDLRNTIGLNLTNRLVSTHNVILVKIIIYSSVTSYEIYSFSKKYNIHELKNVQSRTYAGRMHSWTDLDALITKKDLRCGKSRVSITPIYNFLKCPPSLRTVYDGSQDYSKAKAMEKAIAMKIKRIEAQHALTAELDKKNATRKKNPKSADPKDASGSKSTKETLESEKDKAPENKSSNEKPSDVKGASRKDNNSDSKNNVSETNNAKDITDTKNVKVSDAKNTKVATTKKIESKPAAEVTTTEVETIKTPVKEVTKAVTKRMAKVITKPVRPEKEVKSIPAVIKKPNTKVLPKSVKSPKSLKVDAKSKRNESDFDELSDHDILKILSSGIVLDECSGSEED